MTGKTTYVSAFDERIKLKAGMIAFIPADDLLWETIINTQGHHTIEINGIKHILGPIDDVKKFQENARNDQPKVLAVEFGGDLLPIHHEDAIRATGEEQDKIIEFETVKNELDHFAIII